MEAARQADTAKLKKYIAADTINFKHPYTGDTALHLAVRSPHPKRKQAVEQLARKGARIDEKNKDFLTPLHVAADESHYDIMDVLLRHGAKVRYNNNALFLYIINVYSGQCFGRPWTNCLTSVCKGR